MWLDCVPSAAAGRVAHDGPARDLGELQEKLAGYAAQTVEADEAEMEHAVKAALHEHDRIVLTEISELKLSFRRCPVPAIITEEETSGNGGHETDAPGIGHVDHFDAKQGHVDELPFSMNVSAERAKPLLNSRGREELRVVAERVRGEIEAELAQERCRRWEVGAKVMERLDRDNRMVVPLQEVRARGLERLERDHRVEQDLLARDIYQHMERLRKDATSDIGFTNDKLLIHHMRFSDAAKTEQLRFDWAREREARIRKDLIALQREQKAAETQLSQQLDKHEAQALVTLRARLEARGKETVAHTRARLRSHTDEAMRSLARSEETAARTAQQARLTNAAALQQTETERDEYVGQARTAQQARAHNADVGEARDNVQKLFEGARTRAVVRKEKMLEATFASRRAVNKLDMEERRAVAKLEKELEERRNRAVRTIETAWRDRVREGQTRRVHQWAERAERAEDVRRFKELQRASVMEATLKLYPERGLPSGGTMSAAGQRAPVTRAPVGASSQGTPHRVAQKSYPAGAASLQSWAAGASPAWRRAERAHSPPKGLSADARADVTRVGFRFSGGGKHEIAVEEGDVVQ
ncbi:hypothetical protein T484DRAFT_1834855, partial [Baffinella frigidus]